MSDPLEDELERLVAELSLDSPKPKVPDSKLSSLQVPSPEPVSDEIEAEEPVDSVDPTEDQEPEPDSADGTPPANVPPPEPELSPPTDIAVIEDPIPQDNLVLGGEYDLDALAVAHTRDYEECRQNIKSDRQTAQRILELIEGRVNNGLGGARETEALVGALSALTNCNGHYTKLIEQKTKLLAVLKPKASVTVNNNLTASADQQDLRSILELPHEPGEDV